MWVCDIADGTVERAQCTTVRRGRVHFNDDMQGTAAVVLAAGIAAVRARGSRMRDQRVVIYGAGTAGMAIADMLRDVMVGDGLSESGATRRFWALDRPGLLTSDFAALRDFQEPYARPAEEIVAWSGDGTGGDITLADVVANAKPTMVVACLPSVSTGSRRGGCTAARAG